MLSRLVQLTEDKVTLLRRCAKMSVSFQHYSESLPSAKLWNNLRSDRLVHSHDDDYSSFSQDDYNLFFSATQSSSTLTTPINLASNLHAN